MTDWHLGDWDLCCGFMQLFCWIYIFLQWSKTPWKQICSHKSTTVPWRLQKVFQNYPGMVRHWFLEPGTKITLINDAVQNKKKKAKLNQDDLNTPWRGRCSQRCGCIKMKSAYCNPQGHSWLFFTDQENPVTQELLSHLPRGLSIWADPPQPKESCQWLSPVG